KREIKEETYNSLKEKAYKEWEEKLSAIEISDEDKEKAKTFYSCFYRGLLFPTTFYELDKDNKPYHYNADLDKVYEGTFFTNNGFWDTYRTEYPLLTIVFPDLVKQFIEGFINYSEEISWLPKWLCPGEVGMMPGALIEAVIADAAVKGIISGDLLKRAYKLLKKNAYEVYGKYWLHGRRFLDDYMKYGYIPYNNHECINNTLDCAYGDFCIAQVAKIVGDNETYNDLMIRAKNYQNLFDKNVGFMRGKDKEGNYRKEFLAIEWGGDNCEGSYWQNSFAVYHDVDGLASLYGGKDKFIEKLDELFATEPKYEVGYYQNVIHEMSEMAACDFGQCAISNQPSFHLPWLYSMLGNKEKTIYWTTRLVNEAFNYSEKGFPGDEDNGSMSSWYVFACLGFYSVCPGKDEFSVGKQQFN
ncbi:MAG: glycoside hydrolase family 92 protein, partial [Bacilli bacterium]|nr:glycoside hydrolase family 92 protein [Bacilli bacterium]